MSFKKRIPLAYFITFTCYGARLHGDEKGSVFKTDNQYGSPFIVPNHYRKMVMSNIMKEPPYIMDQKQRQIVLNSICSTCRERGWTLIAAHIRSNHVHLVVQAPQQPPEIILTTIKISASRQLNAHHPDQKNIRRWTRHGSTIYLWQHESIARVVQYVLNEQGHKMESIENVQFSAIEDSAP